MLDLVTLYGCSSKNWMGLNPCALSMGKSAVVRLNVYVHTSSDVLSTSSGLKRPVSEPDSDHEDIACLPPPAKRQSQISAFTVKTNSNVATLLDLQIARFLQQTIQCGGTSSIQNTNSYGPTRIYTTYS